MERFSIFNKSSEDMSEVESASVDLIFAGPPYNIGTRYGENKDDLALHEYQSVLKNVFKECARVLKDEGVLVIEVADSVFSSGVYIQLAGYVQSLCLKSNLKVIARHFNFASSDNGAELPEEHLNEDYTTTANAHSNCHQILVLSKPDSKPFDPVGKIMYFDYLPVEGHPCPSPQGEYEFILDTYFTKGMTILDPFMGTAVVGGEVLRRGGVFIGFEQDASIFELAKTNLSKIL